MDAGAVVASSFALGLAGALHCAGMCGPFALALGWRDEAPAVRAAKLGAYVAGKCAAYATLALAVSLAAGAISAELGHEMFGEREHALGVARSVLAWLAGGAMALAGLHALGLRFLRENRIGAAMHAPFAALLRSARQLPPLGGAAALGAITGCLPCGLSWSAILFAASAGGASTVLAPLAFGLATAPALIAAAAGGALVPARRRVALQRAAAVGLVLFGVWTAWRGGVPWAQAHGLPPCCEEGRAPSR